MKTSTKRALLVVGGLVVTTSLVAGGRYCYHHEPEQRAEWMLEKISEKLELSDAQKKKLIVLKNELIETLGKVRQSRESARENILTLLQQETMDREKALIMINERTNTIDKHAPQIVEAIGNFYDSLTPKQREELREHVAKRMEYRHYRYRGKIDRSAEDHDDS